MGEYVAGKNSSLHFNPVNHGLVGDPLQHPLSSYRWFMRYAASDLKRKVDSTPADGVNIGDDL